MRRLPWVPLVLAFVTASCRASYPTTPDASIIAVQVFYTGAMSYATVGSSYSFKAYAVQSDGAYFDVTDRAAWFSSDRSVLLAIDTHGGFTAPGPGHADVAARYESLVGGLSISVARASDLAYPRLSVSGGDPGTVGMRTPIYLSLLQSPTSSQTVTNLATWTSAAPSVVTVEGGSVTAVGVGTTVIRAAYNGLTVDYGLSVHPSK